MVDTQAADPDLETALLLSRLCLDDVTNVANERKGKRRYDSPKTDEEVAFELQKEDLLRMAVSIQDTQMAQSVSNAANIDAAILERLRTEEQAALDDHNYALAVSQGRVCPSQSTAQKAMERLVGVAEIEQLATTTEPRQARGSGTNQAQAGSSGTSREPKKSTDECTACFTALTRMTPSLRGPCGHPYCQPCMRDLVQAAIGDESLFPVRCCKQSFPVEDLYPILPVRLRAQFKDKAKEFGTPASQRLYCPNRLCSLFLGSTSDSRAQVVMCVSCYTRICNSCKEVAHDGRLCKESEDALRVRELAKSQGWQTCPGCQEIVELSQGCYHMTCRCRAEFCYLCAVKWKNCRCPQWDEQLLLTAAEERVQNVERPAANPVLFQQQIQRMADQLRSRHDCINHWWRKRNGGGHCAECHHYLREYLLVCRNCSLAACVRCSRNRL